MIKEQNFPTLYKIDNKGKIRNWSVCVEIFDDYGLIKVNFGEKNGKQQTKVTKIESGKNIGKSNETSIEEQCISEAQSKWNKQLDKGYSLNPTKSFTFRPMLAQRFDKFSHKIEYPAYVQPKIDGLRCNIFLDRKIKSQSRLGKQYKVLNHIEDSLEEFFQKYPSIILDGELFTRELNFQEIISAVKRDEKNELTTKIEYWIYDLYDQDNPSLLFKDRLEILQNIDRPHIRVLDTQQVNSELEVLDSHNLNIKRRFEGTIVRNNSVYEIDKRSYNLQKLKDFQDDEFLIVGVTPDKNGEAVFTCKTSDGKMFDVKPEGTHQERVNYLLKKNIGKQLTVRFFEYTNDGIPRFPVGVGINVH